MLETKLGKIKLEKPLVLASGILGTSAPIMNRAAENGCGAVTLKSIGPKEWGGHPNPTVIDFGAGLLNAVGLPTPGYLNMEEEWREINEQINVPVIASIYGTSTHDFVKITKYISKKKPAIIELNVSCPNKEDGMMFSQSEKLLAKLIREVKKATKIPIMVKLTPNCDDISKLAVVSEKNGADMLCLINTVVGMVIDANVRMPVLDYKSGGISGKALKPIAIKAVYDCYKKVKIPIVGTGGVCNGLDAIEMIMAGASAVGVGTAVFYDGPKVFKKINKEMESWMKEHKVKSVKEIIGCAHAT